MKDAICSCIEEMEGTILKLEADPSAPAMLAEVLEQLGLAHVKLPSAQVVTLFDMLTEGIQPVTPDLITALLGICEAHKRLLFSMGGFNTDRTAELEKMAEPSPEGSLTDESDKAEASGSVTEHVEPEQKEDPVDPTELPDQTPPQPSPATDASKAPKNKKDGGFSVRVNTEKLDNLINWVGKLMVSYAVISQNKHLDSATIAGLREMDKVIGQIKGEVDKIRLVPMKQIFMPLHRLVTSTAQKVQKKITFRTIGDDLELDKLIVENLNEPLVHILRNAVDHGVEPPEIREAAGKPATGRITLKAWRKGDHAFLSVEDNGRGLNPEKIEKKAHECGLLQEEDSCSYDDLYQLIMHSGFSTADQVTDISGRGVGMDAVLKVVQEQLGGDIKVESTPGEGTRFLISIPLDRSMNEGIVDALITRVGNDTFIIPSRDVLEVYSATKQETVNMPDGSRTVSIRGEIHPVIPLNEYFDIPSIPSDDGYLHTIVVEVGVTKAALLIDEVITQQQAVVTGFTIPVQDIYQLPILGYGMLGETDALVVDVENLLDRLKTSDGGLSIRR